jgi:glutathione reductase (NADPH)
MPPIFDKPTVEKYDYIVLGGGSGGSGTSVCYSIFLYSGSGSTECEQRRAASYGKKVAVIERHPYLGGTCVNVGKLIIKWGKA